jgi:hypothetical protein
MIIVCTSTDIFARSHAEKIHSRTFSLLLLGASPALRANIVRLAARRVLMKYALWVPLEHLKPPSATMDALRALY